MINVLIELWLYSQLLDEFWNSSLPVFYHVFESEFPHLKIDFD